MVADPRQVIVLIPAYEPDGKLLALLPALKERFSRLVLVDDGSGPDYKPVFDAARPLVEAILVHPENRGKGAALKTGFGYAAEYGADVVTADADGQHDPADIARVADALQDHRDGLVLGVRAFSSRDVPFRSRLGNGFTRWFFNALTGLHVTDTQTGLRGIPAPLLSRLLAIPGDRFEYEMVMLADARDHASPPFEVPIRTIYLDGNRSSHHRPLVDTYRILKSLVAWSHPTTKV